ncbi:MAG TPA: hypothetical protein H9759_10950 [Candidatus Dietzia intestinipullorum]|nr:hypothetical protein [Candidatus Dietzia intestinipullorum]
MTRAERTGSEKTRAERRFEWQQTRSAGSLRSWRTPARRRLLVQLNWVSLAIMAAIVVAGYFWLPIIIAWLPMTVVICTVWTMLRLTIDSKDTAPARYLDEFETDTLLAARSRALNVTTGGLFVISMVLIFGSSLELGDGHKLAYTMGGLGILTFLASAVIPASAMVRTMDPGDDDASDPTR